MGSAFICGSSKIEVKHSLPPGENGPIYLAYNEETNGEGTIDFSEYGLKVGDTIEVICIGAGGGGGCGGTGRRGGDGGQDGDGYVRVETPTTENPDKNIWYCLGLSGGGIGAGGGGGCGEKVWSGDYATYGGAGGGSGAISHKSLILDKLIFEYTIGKAGKGSTSNTATKTSEDGGTTYFGSTDNFLLKANGGHGGENAFGSNPEPLPNCGIGGEAEEENSLAGKKGGDGGPPGSWLGQNGFNSNHYGGNGGAGGGGWIVTTFKDKIATDAINGTVTRTETSGGYNMSNTANLPGTFGKSVIPESTTGHGGILIWF